MEQIKVDIIPGRAIPVCHASQFDDGRVIRVNLTNNYSSDYVLDGTEEVTVNVRKVDGNLVVKQCDVVTGRSYIDVVTTEQMTACHGSNLADLTIKKSGTTIGTMNFILEVEKDPLEDGVVSASEIYNLEMQIREINEQILPGQVAEQLATMYDGSDVVFDDTPTEDHGIPYTVTSAGIKAKFDGLDLSENSLNNVDLDPEPADGDALVYNATTNKWINAEAGKKTLEELNDVDLSTPPSDKQVLVYDNTEEKWIAGDGSRVWEGTQAEYNALTEIDPDVTYFITDGSAIDLTLGGLQDTVIDTPVARNVLTYDSGTQKWVNSIPNVFVGNIASGGSIRSILTDTSIKKGVYFYETRYASDNPAGDSAVTTTLIYKNSDNGNYSKVYATTGKNIYFASTSSSVPSTLTWALLVSVATDITSDVTFNETVTGTNTKIYYKNGTVYINYQGESKTHASGDELFTLPAGYRPLNLLYTPFVVNGGAYGNFEIAANGKAKINQISSSSVTGRIYATVSFPAF